MAQIKNIEFLKSNYWQMSIFWPKASKGFSKLCLFLTVIIISTLTLGFAWFSYQVQLCAETKLPQKSDAIVVLTGDANRLETAFMLMDKRLGERLLITGVNKRTSKKAIFNALKRSTTANKINIDLGHKALNTIGNAVETAHWARLRGYKKLTIVTSDYHMTRSLLEFKRVMPNLELIPYPAQPNKIISSDQSLRAKLKEYGKLVAATVRMQFLEYLPLTKLAFAY